MKPVSHVVLTSFCVLSSTATLAGCAGDKNPMVVAQEPFREDWTVEHEGDFDVLDDEKMPRITSLTIGTPDPFGENFLNRGDVIVDFTGESGRIKIEFRRFTFAANEDAAEDDSYEKLSLWAYNANTTNPKPPKDMEEDADCTDDAEAWLDGCAIYVYYEGQNQLERAGVDIRVTLPPDYRQTIDILTSDNTIEDTYPNRGNVCINNLNASADVELESGIAVVKMASDVTPAPGCDPASVNDCTNVDDPGTFASMEGLWTKNCACAKNLDMGSLTVQAKKPYAADITVDAPVDLWTSISAENEAGDGEDVCPIVQDGFGDRFVPDPMQYDPDEPWRSIGDTNKPSDAALSGGGFAFKLTSADCAPVAAVEDPKDWDPDNDDPEADVRGNIEICAGCLDDNPCENAPFD